ncbi:DEAD/DEAH box helicase family protein [symbiont of Argiope bruennichi]|uniref:DEAD/DEAH box helicase family protein n=1 Tax=symbiont of Argiope bruennichi TaxID=2810479 RepID=UPI003DA4DFBF
MNIEQGNFKESHLKNKIKECLADFNNGAIDESRDNDVFLLYPELNWTNADPVSSKTSFKKEDWHFADTHEKKRWFNEKQFLLYLKKIKIEFKNGLNSVSDEKVIKNLNEIFEKEFGYGYENIDETIKDRSFLNFLKQEHYLASIAKNIKLIDLSNIKNNIFTFKEEVTYTTKKSEKFRFDLVLFVNGFPLVVLELKKNLNKEAAGQLGDYVKKCKNFFIPNVFCCCALGSSFYLSNKKNFTETPYIDNSKIKKWITQVEYNNEEQEIIENSKKIRAFVTEVLAPERVLSFLNVFNYIFSVGNRRERRICYSHQFLAAFAVLKRYKENKKLGIVWHPTGTGKTTTMYYTIKLILNWVDNNLTFFIVTDRRELLDQTSAYFESCYENKVYKVKNREDLEKQFKKEDEKIIKYAGCVIIFNLQKITDSIYKLQDYFVEKGSDKYVFLVDEAHRSHSDAGKRENFSSFDRDEGDPFSYSQALWDVFSNSKFLGFTATIVSNRNTDTKKKFGEVTHQIPLKKAVQENFIVACTCLTTEIHPPAESVNKNKKKVDEIEPEIERNSEEAQKNIINRHTSPKDVIKQKIYSEKFGDDRFIETAVEKICKDYKEEWINEKQKIWGKSLIVCKSISAANYVYKIFLEKSIKNKVLSNEYDYYKRVCEIEKTTPISYKKFCEESIKIIYTSNNTQNNEDNDDFIQGKIRMDSFFVERVRDEFKKQRYKDYNKSNIDIKIVIVVEMLLVGYDCPPLENIYLLKDVSPTGAVQLLGRVDRNFTFEFLDEFGIKRTKKKEIGRIHSFTGIDLFGLIRNYYENFKETNDFKENSEEIRKLIECFIEKITLTYTNILYELIGKEEWKNFKKKFFNVIEDFKKGVFSDEVLDFHTNIYIDFRKKIVNEKPFESKSQKKYYNEIDSLYQIKYNKLVKVIPNFQDIFQNFLSNIEPSNYITYHDFYLHYKTFYNKCIQKVNNYTYLRKQYVFSDIRKNKYKLYLDIHFFYWLEKIIKINDQKIIKNFFKDQIEFIIEKKNEIPFFSTETKIIKWSAYFDSAQVNRVLKSKNTDRETELSLGSSEVNALSKKMVLAKEYLKNDRDKKESDKISELFVKIFSRYGLGENLQDIEKQILLKPKDDIRISISDLKEFSDLYNKINKFVEKIVPLKDQYYYTEDLNASENELKESYYCYSKEVFYRFCFNIERAIRNYFTDDAKLKIFQNKKILLNFLKDLLIKYFEKNPNPKKDQYIEHTGSSKWSIKDNFMRFTKQYFGIKFDDCFGNDKNKKGVFLEEVYDIYTNMLRTDH